MKLVLLITSISFWWYCNNIVASVLVGVALFEVFHDVQYFSLVWIYNRKRVESDSSIGGFMHFVFRRSGALVGVYIGLVLAYGGLSLSEIICRHATRIKNILTGVVTASALLHFYYDEFIWKLRDKTNETIVRYHRWCNRGYREVVFYRGWALHGAKWVAIFVIPLAILWFAEIRSTKANSNVWAQLLRSLPTSARAHVNYATELQEAGRDDEAAKELTKAIRLNPVPAKAHVKPQS